MRVAQIIVVLVAGCSFEAPVTEGPSLPGTGVDAAGPGVDAPTADAAADAAPDAAVKVCAASYVTVPAAGTTSKYRRVQVQTEWLIAKADCESDGGYLVIPETAAEATAILTFVNPLLSSPYYWAGVLDPELDNTWIDVRGQPFTPGTWGTDQPEQRVGEIYALVGSNARFYDWFDYGTQEYACECSP